MRILCVNPVGVVGGAEQALLSILAAIKESNLGLDLHLLVCTDGPLIERARELAVSARLLAMPVQMASLGDSSLDAGEPLGLCNLGCRIATTIPMVRSYVQQMQAVVRELQPDLIHSNGMKTHLLASLAAGRRLPVLWHLHDYCSSRRMVSHLLRWARSRAAGGVAVSESVAADARTILPGFPVDVIPNGIDTRHFSPGPGEGARLDALAGLPTADRDTLRVGLVATFARWKGQDIFLEAVARLRSGGFALPVRFYIIGGPIYQTQGSQFSEQELRSKASELGIANSVGFIGLQRDTVDIYRSLDVVVHASTRAEPFGLTIVEAMACAKPVIVSQAGGAAELFTHNYDAVGVPPGQPGAMASAMADLLQSPHRRQDLGSRARQTALDRYGRDRLGTQFSNLYRRFAGAGVIPNVLPLADMHQGSLH
jgi:glycosyltransferase involved in cell wall biosynthesis